MGHACPRGLLFRYFVLAGILLHSGEYIFRAIDLLKGTTKPAINKPASYSRCMSRGNIRDFEKGRSEDLKIQCTHTIRSKAATAMAQAKTDNPAESSRLLRLQGGWRSDNAKDLYIKDSIANRLSLTKSLNISLGLCLHTHFQELICLMNFQYECRR